MIYLSVIIIRKMDIFYLFISCKKKVGWKDEVNHLNTLPRVLLKQPGTLFPFSWLTLFEFWNGRKRWWTKLGWKQILGRRYLLDPFPVHPFHPISSNYHQFSTTTCKSLLLKYSYFCVHCRGSTCTIFHRYN